MQPPVPVSVRLSAFVSTVFLDALASEIPPARVVQVNSFAAHPPKAPRRQQRYPSEATIVFAVAQAMQNQRLQQLHLTVSWPPFWEHLLLAAVAMRWR